MDEIDLLLIEDLQKSQQQSTGAMDAATSQKWNAWLRREVEDLLNNWYTPIVATCVTEIDNKLFDRIVALEAEVRALRAELVHKADFVGANVVGLPNKPGILRRQNAS